MAKQEKQEVSTSEEGYKTAMGRIAQYKLKSNGSLSLKGLKLKDIPPEIFELENLQFLSIGLNPISVIPPGVLRLKQLKHFNATRCKFSDFPEVLFQMSSLELINLTGNQIENIPENISQLKTLKTLSMGSNRLTDIPSSISKIPALANLDFSDNNLRSLPVEMVELVNLRNLVLSKNPIKFLEGDKGVNISGKNAAVPVLRYFMNLSRGNNSKDNGKFESHIEFTTDIKTAFYQYLVYFNSFVEKTKGKDLKIQISDDDTGLTISGDIKDKELINAYLIEFVGFIKDKVETIDPVFEKAVTSTEKELVMIELRNQVRHMTTQLELKNLEVRMLNGEVTRLMEIIGLEKRHPHPIIIQNTSNSTSNAVSTNSVDFKVELPALQADFLGLKNELYQYLNEAQRNELETIDAELIAVDENATADSITKTPFKRLKRIFEQLNNPESDWCKAVSGTKKGIGLLQSLGKKYNKIAPWLAMPSIPDVFLSM